MTRSRPALLGVLLVAVTVLLVASGLFGVQYAQTHIVCSSLPGARPCADEPVSRLAVNGLFASVSGLLVAVVLSAVVGLGWRRDGPPNVELARRLTEEERGLSHYLRRRAQLDEWNRMAQARALEEEARAAAEAIAAEEAAAAADAALLAQIGLIEEEAPQPEVTEEVLRRRAIAEKLIEMAREKPDAVAAVVTAWVNQPIR